MSGTPGDRDQELDALTEELVEVQDQLLAIYDLAQVMRGQLEPEPLLAAVLHEARRLVRADGGFASVGTAGGRPLLVLSPGSPLDPGGAEELAAGAAGRSGPAVTPLPGGGRVLTVPIPLRDRAGGCLGLVVGAGGTFGMPQQKLAAALAALAGSQLEGVLLHQETLRRTRMELEFELARRVQTGLSPAPPARLQGLDLHAESRAARAVGGDFYDFTKRDDGRLVCVLGDVAGKGVPAALLVAMTRASIRTASRGGGGGEPANVLGRANMDLYEDFSQLGLFATVIVIGVDRLAGSAVLANAGHSPVIYRPAGASAHLVRAEVPPLGVLPDWMGASQSLRLDRGDLLVAATDGFSEAERAGTGELFGYDRLLELTDRAAEHGAAAVTAAFFRATDEFSDGEASDDRTVLVIRGV